MRTTLIGDPAISPEALEEMRESRGKLGDGTRWAAYQNHDLSSRGIGELRFLAVGPECTHREPPPRLPDSPHIGTGWRHVFVGWVDLDTGRVIPKEATVRPAGDFDPGLKPPRKRQ